MTELIPDEGFETGVPRKYDAAFKVNLLALAAAFMSVLRPGATVVAIESLSVERKKWLERQEDALFRITFSDGKVWLLHLEIQATNDPEMLGRMMVYGGLDHIAHKAKTVQVVLYIGADEMQMEAGAESESGRFDYRLIDIRTLSPDLFMRSNSPEIWTYAYLAASDSATRKALILEMIEALTNGPFSSQTRAAAVATLVAIAHLRTEKEFIKQKIKSVATELKIDLRDLPWFDEVINEAEQKIEEAEQKGIEKGIEKGIQQGIQKGIEQGIEKGHTHSVLNLRRKTGASAEVIADTLDFDLEWVKKVLIEYRV